MAAALPIRSDVTALLATTAGDETTLERLVPLLYDELRELAHRALARERREHTLQTTALVHEAYLKLVDDTKVTRQGRAYFFAAAARAMRQVLVDQARRRNAEKRGGGVAASSLDDNQIGVDGFEAELLDLDRALDQLAERNPRHARVVECRFFGGLSVEETADALGTSPRTVKYDWALARAWLYETLHGEKET
ncbi:MAG TPA: ECF-type sigma factor [Gemmatimonadaceae bacterium]|nr:ECF-type sigma factor [Gemmatimonadaceae bacterium]